MLGFRWRFIILPSRIPAVFPLFSLSNSEDWLAGAIGERALYKALLVGCRNACIHAGQNLSLPGML